MYGIPKTKTRGTSDREIYRQTGERPVLSSYDAGPNERTEILNLLQRNPSQTIKDLLQHTKRGGGIARRPDSPCRAQISKCRIHRIATQLRRQAVEVLFTARGECHSSAGMKLCHMCRQPPIS